MRKLNGAAGTIAVEEHGDPAGTPVVLVHGMAGDASFWASTVRALGRQHRVIVPELRGHGRSAIPSDDDYSVEAHADDLIAVLDQLQLGPVVLVGHSFGASPVLVVARAIPEQVAGMILVDPAGDFSYVPPEALHSFLAGLKDPDHYAATLDGAIDMALNQASAETDRRVRAAMLAAPPQAISAMYSSLLLFAPLPFVDKYYGKLLLITTPVNAAPFTLHTLRPRLPHHEMAGVSHWAMMDRPGEVARLIERFLVGER
jgi:pimeloyl-ACP methyl ester carboxylesterase